MAPRAGRAISMHSSTRSASTSTSHDVIASAHCQRKRNLTFNTPDKMSVDLTRRFTIACVAALAMVASAVAQEFPSKPIRLVVPFAPGGPTDTLARAYAKSLSDVVKQPVEVDNKPGAVGNIGIDIVAKSP